MAPHWEGKKYILVKSENFDAYLKELGVGNEYREMGFIWKPIFELINEGNGVYLIRSTSPLKNTELRFTIDQEFDETTADGRTCRAIFTFENENKLVQTQRGDIGSVIVREFHENGFVCTLTANNVMSTRTYELVK